MRTSMFRRASVIVATWLLLAAGVWAAEPVTVTVLDYFPGTGPADMVYDATRAAIEREFPNIKYEHEGLTSDKAREKLSVQMASGTPPDVSYMVNSLGRQYSKNGLLMNILPYMKKDREWANMYVPSAVSQYTWDGKMYLAPAQGQLGGLFYNTKVFADFGLKEPARTWPEFLQQVKKIRAGGINPMMTGGKEYRYAWIISQILERTAGVKKMYELYHGSQRTAWNDPKNGFVSALTYFKQLIDAGAFPADVNGISNTVGYMMFGDRQAAMWYEGTWLVGSWKNAVGPDFVKELGWTTFPAIPGEKGDQDGGIGGVVQGWGVSSKISGAKRDAALLLVKRLTDKSTGSQVIVKAGSIVFARLDQSVYDQIDPLVSKAIQTYAKMTNVIVGTDVEGAPAVDNTIKKVAIPAIIEGTMTPEQAAEAVNKAAVEFFKTNK
jgi:raffinose/stachyose/melibiose transport system substrate-binding protein